ncbi:hypothetical protein [Aurantimonas coralicida]|uniref:hypothetical protein n=1 Tax=Aurantimonas coralicida TaxID=182270 RepID=UPI001E5891CD|nr:hypothetical protein [Aurantimonas coralicida]MCD1644333.1 hypothetical protein [Aurantimonas coralicida]
MQDDRYTLEKASDGYWSVVDIFTDAPAEVRDEIMIRMDMREAADIVDLLSTMGCQKRASLPHPGYPL